MIKNALLTVVATLLFFSAYGQKKEKIKGDRNVTTKETRINSFNRIVVGEKFKIDLIEGNEASVFVEADDNLHDVIDFSVADSTLYFNTSKRITTSKKISIKVTFTKALRQIETKENGEVSSLTSINLDDIVLVHSGSSKAFLAFSWRYIFLGLPKLATTLLQEPCRISLEMVLLIAIF